MKSLQRHLEEMLEAHGLSTSTYNQWVLVDGNLPGISASVVDGHEVDDGYYLQLDVVVVVEQDLFVIESFGGAGGSREEAVGQALEKF